MEAILRFKIALSLCSVITCLLCMSSLSGHVWTQGKGTARYETRGLWKQCYDNSNTCYKLTGSGAPPWLQACRAFSILAALTSFCCIVLSVLVFVKGNIVKGFHVSIGAFVASGLMVIGLVIYIAKVDFLNQEKNYEPGWSYYIGWVGVLLGIATSVVGFLKDRNEKYEAQAI